MRAGTVLRLAAAGTRTDAVRVTLTGLGSAAATLGLLSAATVLSISGGGGGWAPYTNGLLAQPGLRPGLATALVLATLPVLVFVAQCARLGAPARQRRLAAYRLAGATPADTVRIAASESGAAAALGTALGAAVYFAGRVLADAPDAAGLRPLPTDVLPAAWAIVAVLLVVPLCVVALSILLLRRVVVSPFGLVRRVRTGRPPLWPAALLIAGVAVLVGGGPLVGWLLGPAGDAFVAFLPVLAGGVLLVVVGLLFGGAWLTHAAGGALRRVARRPAVLLAAARAEDDPWLGARTQSVLFVVVLLGAGCAELDAGFHDQPRAHHRMAALVARQLHVRPEPTTVDPFYDRAFRLIDLGLLVMLAVTAGALLVAIVEQVTAQRRPLARAVAGGVPRRTLAGSVLVHALLTGVPGMLVATVAGAVAAWGYLPGMSLGRPAGWYCLPAGGPPYPCPRPTAGGHAVHVSAVHVHVTTPAAWGALAALLGTAVVALLAVAAVSTLFIRPATRPAELRTD